MTIKQRESNERRKRVKEGEIETEVNESAEIKNYSIAHEIVKINIE